MRVIECRDWKDFYKRFLFDYCSHPRGRRAELLFRGQPESGWPLRATLDRDQTFPDDAARARHYEDLLEEFRRECIGLVQAPLTLPDGTAFELLARHHGIPSQLLDWTESPYIAAFFAFDEATKAAGASAAIWVFDRSKFVFEESGVDLIDDREMLRFNPRALRQRGVFTRVRTVRQPLEDLIGLALTKITIPASSRTLALSDLDEMMINSATMYTDFDGAARTARSRFRV